MKGPRTYGITQMPIQKRARHVFEQTAKAMNNLSFGESDSNTGLANITCWKANGACPALANTDFVVQHGLKHVPIGWIAARITPAGILYLGTNNMTDWTAATSSALGQIVLRCSVANMGYFLLII